ncbi:MAG: N-acetylneuraminate synthase family protein, partial [Candidatus Omnitrophica bacterium]|nr:N-acetylneuraminate synthase family protein [Candidatus Omnitrophota bacterium]
SHLEMLKKVEYSFDVFRKLKEFCDKEKILFLSTPFDHESADFLDDLVPIFKLSSGEVTNLPFIEYISRKKKPIILSTGMSTLEEVERAVNMIKKHHVDDPDDGYAPLTILHCTTNYPCPYEDANLRALRTLSNVTGLPVGYSDHTLGIDVSLASAAMGAEVIEKHFTLDKNMQGPDHKASIEPDELKQLVANVRDIERQLKGKTENLNEDDLKVMLSSLVDNAGDVEKSMGNEEKKPTRNELNIMKIARKSLVVARNLKKGEIIEKDMFVIKRPGEGIQPSEAAAAIGRELVHDKKEDENLFWEDLR